MKPGLESQTAVMVAMGRAAAHGNSPLARYSDPTALVLLPEEARRKVERFRSEPEPRSPWKRMKRALFYHRSQVMAARTVAIDDAIRAAGARQLVILGAGLDGRAWRMPELADTVVYEVDHPDSQKQKRARIGKLTQTAHEVRFVPVDFTRDALGEKLAAFGHDAGLPTTWVWEGVVMYLTPAQVDATLSVIARRSAPGSHLVILYHRPAFMLRIVGPIVRRVGEPLRSSFTPEAMRALLGRHGFEVVRDQSLSEIGGALSADLDRSTRRMKHMGIVTARRPGGAIN